MFRSLSSSLIVNSASLFSDDLKSLYAAFNLVFISEISFLAYLSRNSRWVALYKRDWWSCCPCMSISKAVIFLQLS